MLGEGALIARTVNMLAKAMAVAGGLVLIGIVLLILVSVSGRALMFFGLRPIRGDYELVEAAMGFAVFAFLPWVHLTRGHAVVTLFTERFSQRANAWLLVVADLLMLGAAVFITWRHGVGMLDRFRYGETTLLLKMPLGWSYAAELAGGVVFSIVALYVLARSLSDAIAGRQRILGHEVGH